MKNTVSLKKNRDFQLVYKKAKSHASRHMVVFLLNNGMQKNRLGISVSKKAGHAVARNRIRRRLKETFRLLELCILPGHDLIILPRQNILDAGFADIKSQMSYLLRKHGILQFCQKGDA